MKVNLLPIAAVLAMVGLPLIAQSPKGTGTEKTTTVTGCLSAGAQPNEYKITENGTTYDLFSAGNKVDMSKHVGHKVSVTGKLTSAQPSSPNSASRSTDERMDVTELKHISPTCP